MNRITLFLCLLLNGSLNYAQHSIPAEIEDPACSGINKEAAHATLMPYPSLEEALKADRHRSSFCRSLNGLWRFNWVPTPEQRPADFYKQDYDVSSWKEIPVPSNWQVLGYGTPFYRNMGYTFQTNFPRVMNEPPKKFTSYKERNPVGSYRRDFVLPTNWKGNTVFLTFDGVDAGFFLWVNEQKVGYSVNSRNAAEFNITQYVKPGANTVAVEVYQYTVGSYLEDQDMWRLNGIFRNVTLWCAPVLHTRDFSVTTDLDAGYRDATVYVTAKVKNYSSSITASTQLSASVFNTTVIGQNTAPVPALQPGEETTVRMKFTVKNPLKWTAETPVLHTVVLQLGEGIKRERLSARIGFRKVEIKDRVFMVNGKPVKLKGVNRHEHWPDVGHAVTEAQMIKDIKVIKQGNCNHIRTSHYSNDPRWYELCDEYGIWLVAEANVENHGLNDKLDDEPRLKAAIVDRNIANVENFKNHPSVVIWSLGNESARGAKNFVAALAAVKAIDSTRPVHYCEFGIGAGNPADIDSRMYSGISSVEKSAMDSALTKPYYLCEYAHAMFNSMGSLGDYNDIFDKYPSIIGGAIWEFQDQGLWNRRDPKHPILAYGGGFGEYPNNQYFIHKGVVFSEREPKPHYPEMKHVYQWIGLSTEDPASGIISIRNKYQFIDLSGFTGQWNITENGIIVAKGEISMPAVLPGETKKISVPVSSLKRKAGHFYFINISIKLKSAASWANKGFEVASEQFGISVIQTSASTIVGNISKLTLQELPDEYIVTGNNFSVVFNKGTGLISQITQGKAALLKQNGGPALHLWRAPHIKDDMWADPEWQKKGIKTLEWKTEKLEVLLEKNNVKLTAVLQATGKDHFSVRHTAVYTITADGAININNLVSQSDTTVPIARMGVRLFLDSTLDRFQYFGRGPMENYADRKIGSFIGLYSSTVAAQLTPYEKPMECGNHEDVYWANLTNASRRGLQLNSTGARLQMSALPYSDEELAPVQYKIDLPKSKGTVLCISSSTLGVGSWGCGPKPLPPYRVSGTDSQFSYELRIIPGR